MVVKRFRGETVKDAREAALQALGPDAVIVATRMVPATGWRGLIGGRVVEITAAVHRRSVSERRPAPATPPPPDDEAIAARAAEEIAARLSATGLDASIARTVAESLPSNRRRGISFGLIRAGLETELAGLSARQ